MVMFMHNVPLGAFYLGKSMMMRSRR